MFGGGGGGSASAAAAAASSIIAVSSSAAVLLESEEETATRLAATSDALVVRWLRRCLWRVVSSSSQDKDEQQQQPDEDAVGQEALMLYRMTRDDWIDFMQRQAADAKQKKWQQDQIKRQQRNAVLKKILPHSSSSKATQTTTTSTTTTTTTLNSPTYSRRQQQAGRKQTPGLLQLHMNPSEPFVWDDFLHPDAPYDEIDTNNTLQNNKDSYHNSQASPQPRPVRQAFFWRTSNNTSTAPSKKSNTNPTDATTTTPATSTSIHVHMTTPLHEAARLGHAPWLRLLLETQRHWGLALLDTVESPHEQSSLSLPQFDINARNGKGRTPLHMVCGGMTLQEQQMLLAHKIAISKKRSASQRRLKNKDHNDDDDDDDDDQDSAGIGPPLPTTDAMHADGAGGVNGGDGHRGNRAVRAMHRLFRSSTAATTTTTTTRAASQQQEQESSRSKSGKHRKNGTTNAPNNKKGNHRDSKANEKSSVVPPCDASHPGRLDALMLLLQYEPPEGMESVYINSVDLRGRTALHYAADLGREAICSAVLTSFGAMLTIVDDQSKTPCELASRRHHYKLAAHLEARALLYVDPYGTDEDLLSEVFGANNSNPQNTRLVPPFAWFETLTCTQLQAERERRIELVANKIRSMVQQKQETLRAEEAIFGSDPRLLAAATADKDWETLERQGGDRAMALEMFASLHASHLELFLKAHQWDVARALGAFYEDPFRAFQDADVVLPSTALDMSSSCKTTTTNTGTTADESRNNNTETTNEAAKSETTVEPNATSSSSQEVDKEVKAAPTTTPETPVEDSEDDTQVTCLVCCDTYDASSDEWKRLSGCEHAFCVDCLGDYLSDCARSKSSGVCVLCPHHECKVVLSPLEVLDLSPSTEVYESLFQASLANFVVGGYDLRYCPHAGCAGVVQFKMPLMGSQGLDRKLLETVGAVCTAVHPPLDGVPKTYEGVPDLNYYDCTTLVQPAKAHRFCFHCGENARHWPISCEKLERWREEMQEKLQGVIGEGENGGATGEGGTGDYKDLAHRLWIKANTRPCPKCNAPIEKNDGCNHMCCSKCKYEFCWICRNDWKLHSTDTGGFYRCNRWVEQKEHEFYDVPPEDPQQAAAPTNEDLGSPSTMQATYGTAMHEHTVAIQRSREMARFLHHFRRWSAHAESAELERKMEETSCNRLAPVVAAATEFLEKPGFNFDGRGLSFVFAAFTELLECRSILQHSYAFSYMRYKSTNPRKYKLLRRHYAEKLAFEQSQSELEMMTEQISDVVARSHLRATQSQIIFLTAAAADKRKDFSNIMTNILATEQHEIKRQREAAEAAGGGGTASAVPAKPRSPLMGGGILDDVMGLSGTDSQHSQHGGVSDFTYDVEEALCASLDDFLAANSHDATQDEGIGEWDCPTCTYHNMGGRQCEMCGTTALL